VTWPLDLRDRQLFVLRPTATGQEGGILRKKIGEAPEGSPEKENP